MGADKANEQGGGGMGLAVGVPGVSRVGAGCRMRGGGRQWRNLRRATGCKEAASAPELVRRAGLAVGPMYFLLAIEPKRCCA
jgi:hypothetical protein